MFHFSEKRLLAHTEACRYSMSIFDIRYSLGPNWMFNSFFRVVAWKGGSFCRPTCLLSPRATFLYYRHLGTLCSKVTTKYALCVFTCWWQKSSHSFWQLKVCWLWLKSVSDDVVNLLKNSCSKIFSFIMRNFVETPSNVSNIEKATTRTANGLK